MHTAEHGCMVSVGINCSRMCLPSSSVWHYVNIFWTFPQHHWSIIEIVNVLSEKHNAHDDLLHLNDPLNDREPKHFFLLENKIKLYDVLCSLNINQVSVRWENVKYTFLSVFTNPDIKTWLKLGEHNILSIKNQRCISISTRIGHYGRAPWH